MFLCLGRFSVACSFPESFGQLDSSDFARLMLPAHDSKLQMKSSNKTEHVVAIRALEFLFLGMATKAGCGGLKDLPCFSCRRLLGYWAVHFPSLVHSLFSLPSILWRMYRWCIYSLYLIHSAVLVAILLLRSKLELHHRGDRVSTLELHPILQAYSHNHISISVQPSELEIDRPMIEKIQDSEFWRELVYLEVMTYTRWSQSDRIWWCKAILLGQDRHCC